MNRSSIERSELNASEWDRQGPAEGAITDGLGQRERLWKTEISLDFHGLEVT